MHSVYYQYAPGSGYRVSKNIARRAVLALEAVQHVHRPHGSF